MYRRIRTRIILCCVCTTIAQVWLKIHISQLLGSSLFGSTHNSQLIFGWSYNEQGLTTVKEASASRPSQFERRFTAEAFISSRYQLGKSLWKKASYIPQGAMPLISEGEAFLILRLIYNWHLSWQRSFLIFLISSGHSCEQGSLHSSVLWTTYLQALQ